jgi:ABC-2 type transport system permease protein
MHGFLTIARLTWLEARRRRIVLAAVLGGLAFVLVFATAVFFIRRGAGAGAFDSFEARVGLLMLLVAGLYVVNLLTVAVAIMLAVDTLSGEIDSGVMQTLAAKPISRAAILLGKGFAYWCLTAGYLVLLAGGIVGSLWSLTGFTPPPHVVRAILLVLLGATTLLTLTMAGGTRLKTITNGIFVFGLYGIAFVSGWVEQIGSLLRNDTARRIGTAISLLSPADAMWRRAAYELEPSTLRTMQIGPFATASVPSAAMIAWTLAFVVVTLFVAWRLFRHRPL